jgi:SAM-dependent methyltransferase
MAASRRAANSQFSYAEVLRSALRDATHWLDLGCGHQFLPEWLPEDVRDLPLGRCRSVGIDADAGALRLHPDLKAKVSGTVERLPFAAESFDLVTANMVVEHVQNPSLLFREVTRVLRPGGRFIIHTPNRIGYTTRLTRCIPPGLRPRLAKALQDRDAHDVYPTYYRANTVGHLRRLADAQALTVVALRTVVSSPQLYRVPVLGTLERRLLMLLSRERLSMWRPCIIGQFIRPTETASSRDLTLAARRVSGM